MGRDDDGLLLTPAPERTMGVVQKDHVLPRPGGFRNLSRLRHPVCGQRRLSVGRESGLGPHRPRGGRDRHRLRQHHDLQHRPPSGLSRSGGVYWTCGPTRPAASAFVLWLIYGVYILLRMVVDRPDKQAKFLRRAGRSGHGGQFPSSTIPSNTGIRCTPRRW